MRKYILRKRLFILICIVVSLAGCSENRYQGSVMGFATNLTSAEYGELTFGDSIENWMTIDVEKEDFDIISIEKFTCEFAKDYQAPETWMYRIKLYDYESEYPIGEYYILDESHVKLNSMESDETFALVDGKIDIDEIEMLIGRSDARASSEYQEYLRVGRETYFSELADAWSVLKSNNGLYITEDGHIGIANDALINDEIKDFFYSELDIINMDIDDGILEAYDEDGTVYYRYTDDFKELVESLNKTDDSLEDAD